MNKITCDVLVVGGGAAGMRAAYAAKRSHPQLNICLAVTGTFETGGSSNVVASEALGINAPLNLQQDEDTPEVYLEDTLDTGGGLGDPTLCRILTEESSDRIRELAETFGLYQSPLPHLRGQNRLSDHQPPEGCCFEAGGTSFRAGGCPRPA